MADSGGTGGPGASAESRPAPSATIETVRRALDKAFASLDGCCTLPEGCLLHRPAYPDAWTVAEHLEHVSLVNHYLLLTIGKGVNIARRRARIRPVPAGESDLLRLAPIADPASFPWEPPGHMIPGGAQSVAEVRALLHTQYGDCLGFLERMGAGEGRLCSFRMSVYNLGLLDMYQWLYFLAQHARWHLELLARREENG